MSEAKRDVCEEICEAMRRYGWPREYCMPRCMAAETERVRRMEEEEEEKRWSSRVARADSGGASRWPFV